MINLWISYLSALIGSVAFYGVYDGYISYYLLIVTLALPFLSMAISVYGLCTTKITISPLSGELQRGEKASVSIHVKTRSWLPVAMVKIKYTTQNKTFNLNPVKKTKLLFGCSDTICELPIDTKHVGCVKIDIISIRVYDYLGLFWFKSKKPESRSVIVEPLAVAPDPAPVLPIDKLNSKGLKPKPGGGFAEDYDLREYRIGDPINQVHWKLTTKLDKLVIKEPLVSEKGIVYIGFNFFGTPEEIDDIFGQIAYLSRILIAKMMEYTLCWYDYNGKLNFAKINEATDYFSFLSLVLNNPVPLKGYEMNEKLLKKADWYYMVRPAFAESAKGVK